MRKTSVVITKAIVIHTVDDSYGRVDRSSRTYRTATHAAKWWAEEKIAEWEEKHFKEPFGNSAAYHNMTDDDYAERAFRKDKLYRRSLPIFQRMLA